MSISSNRSGIIVPAYFGPQYPDNIQEWEKLVDAAERLKGRLIVIVNPDSGPGNRANINDLEKFAPQGVPIKSPWFDAIPPQPQNTLHPTHGNGQWHRIYNGYIERIVAFGSKVVGYVATYEGRAVGGWVGAETSVWVGTDITVWFEWYPALSGVFLDQASSNAADADTYSHYSHHAKVTSGVRKETVIINFGTIPHQDYYDENNDDILIVLEDFQRELNTHISNIPQWVQDTNKPEKFGLLLHTTSAINLSRALSDSSSMGIYWRYFTDDIMDNPWDRLPCYFQVLVRNLSPSLGLSFSAYVICLIKRFAAFFRISRRLERASPRDTDVDPLIPPDGS